MRSLRHKFLALAAMVVGFGGVVCSCVMDDDGDDGIEVGDSLPQFAVEMNDGSTVSTSDLAGSESLIVLFDTTCPDCQQVMPLIDSLYCGYGIGAGGESSEQVRFVCISRAQGEDIVSAYWEESGFSMPYSAQDDRTVYNLFAKMTVPRVYVSDSQLIVHTIYTDNPLPDYSDLLAAITELL